MQEFAPSSLLPAVAIAGGRLFYAPPKGRLFLLQKAKLFA